MQGGIIPGQAMTPGEVLETGDEVLGKEGRRLLVARIAKVDPAAQWPGLPSRAAAPVILPRACLPVIESTDRRGGFIQEIFQLGRREEQGMAILAEAAATPADLADGGESGHLGIECGVDGPQLVEVRRPGTGAVDRWCFVVSDHLRIIARELWISVSVWT
jgi:hypothetical protein